MQSSDGGGSIYLYILLNLLIGGLVGYAIGKQKGRGTAGFFFGCFLGIIGWIMVAVGPNYKPKCSECGGVIVEEARKCKHCGTDLKATSPHYAESKPVFSDHDDS